MSFPTKLTPFIFKSAVLCLTVAVTGCNNDNSEPKQEEPKQEEPKQEEPKPEQPKPEQPKPEQPKPEQPKPEQPKPEQPKPDVPIQEEPKLTKLQKLQYKYPSLVFHKPLTQVDANSLALTHYNVRVGKDSDNISVLAKSGYGSESARPSGIREYYSKHPDINMFYYDTSLQDGPASETLIAYGDKLGPYAEQTVIVNDTTQTIDIVDSKTGVSAKYTLHYTPFDLTGHTVADSEAAVKSGKGVTTGLSKLRVMPASLSFPEGSRCFVKTYEKASMPLVILHSYYMPHSFYENASAWEAEKVDKFGDYDFAQVFTVGSNNEYDVTRLVYNADDGQTTDYTLMEHREYGSDWQPRYVGTTKQYMDNIDTKNGLVNCNILNDVAAEFLEAQIIKYYP